MSPRLLAPPGSGGCSFGGEEYLVDESGAVDVPDDAVADLVGHGFTGYIEQEIVPDESLGEYTIKHQGRGRYKIFKDGEEIASGLAKADAEAQVAVLQAAPVMVEVPVAEAVQAVAEPAVEPAVAVENAPAELEAAPETPAAENAPAPEVPQG